MVLDCVVNRISTADADAVLVEGVHVRKHPRGTPFFFLDTEADVQTVPVLLVVSTKQNRCAGWLPWVIC